MPDGIYVLSWPQGSRVGNNLCDEVFIYSSQVRLNTSRKPSDLHAWGRISSSSLLIHLGFLFLVSCLYFSSAPRVCILHILPENVMMHTISLNVSDLLYSKFCLIFVFFSFLCVLCVEATSVSRGRWQGPLFCSSCPFLQVFRKRIRFYIAMSFKIFLALTFIIHFSLFLPFRKKNTCFFQEIEFRCWLHHHFFSPFFEPNKSS